MKIEFYISQLLYRYQCVAVPGFGAFLTEIQSARLNESAMAFYPPRKLVSFNFHLKNNDGLLANHISQYEKISYEEAIKNIEAAVAGWKFALQQGQAILLKNIGQLSLNSEQNLVFEPSDNLNYLTDSFGLSTFVSPKIQREVYKEEVEALEEKAPILFTPERRSNTSYLKYAAIFVLGLGAAGFFGNNYYQEKINSENLIVQQAVQKKVQDKIQEATFFIESPLPAVKLTIKEEKLAYHIVAGAFRNEENAQKIFEKLSAKGYKARRIAQNKHGLHPVLYGSFSNYAEAQKAMSKIQKTENPEAWLLIQEL
ncbi:sporulation related protein [Flavobacterium endophyticum]|uniref:Sporulation related protein n=1 Tax=Flavobacterium endophyticum TaxID=1540163 RepID=A0A495MMY7_9FLAO|nr:SPOR domain-containing protein [Flavobacterium endophyticum]RKS26442.1 sporulation related protein [Flavobacterium endophyticum]